MQRATMDREPIDRVPDVVHEVLRSSGQPLDAATRASMESRFGYDFGRVRIHADGRAAESARAVNALAYTVDRDIVFAAGGHAPHASADRQSLAHELTHALQQGMGRQISGTLTIAPSTGEEERQAEQAVKQMLPGRASGSSPRFIE